MNENQVTITKILEASIEKVWDAWTRAENVKQWLSPEGMTNSDVSLDFKIGGSYRIVMEGHNMPDSRHNRKMAVGGRYLEIKKPNKLVYTWLWEDSPVDTHTTTITILLKKINDKQTEMTLIHTGFADENMKQEHSMGWNSTFRKLDHFLKGGE